MTRMLHASLALGLLAGVPATAEEYTRFEPLPFARASSAGAGCAGIAMVNLPPSWHAGDTAVVLFTTAPASATPGGSLVAALLHEGAAVIEIVAGGPRRCPEDGTAAPHPDPLADLFGALRAVTAEVGAGMVVAMGHGPGGGAAMEAVREEVAARYIGPPGPRFAAASALGDGMPGFARGAAPAGRPGVMGFLTLCEAVRQSGVGGPVAAGRCRDALVPPRAMAAAPQ